MTQLSLIDTPSPWRLDDHTREVGRAGIARARAALCAGLSGTAPDPPPSGRGHPARGAPARRRRRAGSDDRPAAAA
ncbi:MAG TPA: hypothetical protein VKB57_19435 [Acidimicrobiales bacterium]|nr:hypothetical protein [Acidimicrobiales bacterium]